MQAPTPTPAVSTPKSLWERRAFEKQLLNIIPDLRAFARFLAGNPTEADDLVQDTVVRALNAYEHFDLNTNIKAWTFTILRNIRINSYRKRRFEELDEATMSTMSAHANQEDSIELKEVLKALETLPAAQREVITLVRAGGLSYEEAVITAAKSGHPGGSLSAVEILVELYFNHMRIDPANPKWADRDRFILSKGHAAPVLYSVMAERGYSETPKDKLNTLRQFGSVFQGHPDMRFIPSLEASTGSLGQGLSLALGMALGARLDGRPSRMFVMLGDGEIQEGQIWEAAMAASFMKVDNLVAIVDYNQIQLDGFVKDIMDVAPLAEKWRSFGWHTLEIDGHDFGAIQKALAEAAAIKGKPTCLVAHTVKGKGVSFMENNPKYHGVAPTADERTLALQELN